MLNQQDAPQGQHRGIFEVYIPAVDRCLSCRRPYAENERRSSYEGVEVCGGCAAKQEVADLGEKFSTLKSTVSGISARERI